MKEEKWVPLLEQQLADADLLRCISVKIAPDVTNDVTAGGTDDIAGRITVPDDVTDVTDGTWDDVTDTASDEVTDDVTFTDDITGEATDVVTDNAAGDAPDDVTDKANDDAAVDVTHDGVVTDDVSYDTVDEARDVESNATEDGSGYT